MSERRRPEVTEPGSPPEEALDATLRAFSDPITPEIRETAESAGLDAARYHGEARRPPAALQPPSHDTAPMAPARSEPIEAPTLLMPARRPQDATTMPRGVPRPTKATTFAVALGVVLLLLGVGAWAFTRDGSDPKRDASGPSATNASATNASATNASATNASATNTGTGSGTALAATASAPVVAATETTPAATPTPTTVTVAPGVSGFAPVAVAPAKPNGAPSPSVITTTATAGRVDPQGPSPKNPPAVPATTVPSARATTPSTAPTPSAAPTTKYNRFLEEDKK